MSVLVATFNRANYIDECLQSLLSQTRPLDEIVVIDDGSTDGTPKVLAAYEGRIVHLRKDNGGKSTALNLALERTRSDWVWFFDDDDVALPDALERMLQALCAEPGAEFAYSGQIIGRSRDGQPMVRERVVKPPAVAAGALFNHALKQFPFLMQGMLVRRNAVERIGRFDERYLRGQDYDFCVRLLRAARGVPLAEPTFVWRVHDGVRGPKSFQHQGAARGKVWQQYSALMGRELRQNLPLGEYLVPRLAVDHLDDEQCRSALIQRLCVMASKGLIDEMLEDLAHVALLGQGLQPPKLDPRERDACWKVATFETFLALLLESPRSMGDRLVAAAGSGARDVLRAMAQGLFWQARQDELRARERMCVAWIAVRLWLSLGRVAPSGPGKA